MFNLSSVEHKDGFRFVILLERTLLPAGQPAPQDSPKSPKGGKTQNLVKPPFEANSPYPHDFVGKIKFQFMAQLPPPMC